MDILNKEYWISSKSKSEIVEKFIDCNIVSSGFLDDNENLVNFILLILYIRDKNYGLGRKDVSRWMLLEVELVKKGIVSSLFNQLPLFGYWKDFNLMLIDIYGDDRYLDLESNIINHLKVSFSRDINNYYDGKYNLISSLVKYIGKERKSLDKKTGFTRRFVLEMYPDKNLFAALKEFRVICQKLNKIKENEKNKNNYKMKNELKSKYTSSKIPLYRIVNNLNHYPKYISSKKALNKYIVDRDEIDEMLFNKTRGNFLYHDNLIKTLDQECSNRLLNNNSTFVPSLDNWQEFTKYQSLFSSTQDTEIINDDLYCEEDVNDSIIDILENEETNYIHSEKERIKNSTLSIIPEVCPVKFNENSIAYVPYDNLEKINVNIKKTNKVNKIDDIQSNKLNLFIQKCNKNKNIMKFQKLINKYQTIKRIQNIKEFKKSEKRNVNQPSLLNYIYNSIIGTSEKSEVKDNKINCPVKKQDKDIIKDTIKGRKEEDFVIVNIEDLF